MREFIEVLLADDDPDDCLLFEEALAELPVRSSLNIVHDGDELIRVLEESLSLPNIIVLDLNMPKKNGHECLEIITKSETLRRVPVIIFTTSVSEEMVRSLLNNGAADCIRKPSSYNQLKEIIMEILVRFPLNPGIS